MDKSTIGGIILALAGILAGLIIEGGKIAQVLQPTAAMIVLGGTIGAVMIQFPLSVVFGAAKGLVNVFLDRGQEPNALIKELVGYANRARKEGIVSLDGQLATIKDPFLKKALMLAIDGAEPEELRKMMELELDNQEEHGERLSQVFEAAGGYAPTVGIIGAVLGLIQVMQHLEDITEVGKGIAVAFVATIYGVGMANILFLPWAGKLKIKFREEQVLREMKLEGVISILEGMNPRMLETMLMGYLPEHKQPAPAEKAAGQRVSRKKKHKAHANHERWLVSYADFITLLFAFFVVLYASSQADKKKAAQVAASIKGAFQTVGCVHRLGDRRCRHSGKPRNTSPRAHGCTHSRC